VFEKATRCAADIVLLDLEDAVAPDDKEQARKNIIQGLNEIDWGSKTMMIRINGLDTHYMYCDVVALHTDQPHPHVHLVVKAMSEQGKRMNIRKETLREWRRKFARHLRSQGISANATQRAVRGVTKPQKGDGIYWAMRAGRSTHIRGRAVSVGAALRAGNVQIEPGKAQLLDTAEA
jgi:citrate lyase beta subunit